MEEKKESRNINVHEVLRDDDDNKRHEDKKELEIEISERIKINKIKNEKENKINKREKEEKNNLENTR